MIRRALVGLAFASVIGGAGTLPASADDVAPPPIPTPSGGASSGPTYVITPGVGGSQLPPPSDPRAVEKAKEADQARQRGRSAGGAGSGAGTPGAAQPGTAQPGTGEPGTQNPGTEEPGGVPTATAGRQTPLVVPDAAGEKVAPAVRGFAAVVAMLVLYEITAVRRSVFRRRRAAVTAG